MHVVMYWVLRLCVDHRLFFFFERYGDNRELHVLTHSFPTRRSSDLRSIFRTPTRFSRWTSHMARSATWSVSKGWTMRPLARSACQKSGVIMAAPNPACTALASCN